MTGDVERVTLWKCDVCGQSWTTRPSHHSRKNLRVICPTAPEAVHLVPASALDAAERRAESDAAVIEKRGQEIDRQLRRAEAAERERDEARAEAERLRAKLDDLHLGPTRAKIAGVRDTTTKRGGEA